MQSEAPVSTPSTPSRLGELVAQMPRPDRQAGILSDVDDEAVRKAVAEIYRGGKPFVLEAVSIVRYTPLGQWLSRGVQGHFVIKRLSNASSALTPAANPLSDPSLHHSTSFDF